MKLDCILGSDSIYLDIHCGRKDKMRYLWRWKVLLDNDNIAVIKSADIVTQAKKKMFI